MPVQIAYAGGGIAITLSTFGQHRIAASATYSSALCDSESPVVTVAPHLTLIKLHQGEL